MKYEVNWHDVYTDILERIGRMPKDKYFRKDDFIKICITAEVEALRVVKRANQEKQTPLL